MEPRETILGRLDEMRIPWESVRHAPAHTMDDLVAVARAMHAVIPKNLFLTPRNKSAYWLCLVRPEARFKTADISKQIGSSRLSFAEEEALRDILHTAPGAISALALSYESAKDVRLLVDRALFSAERLGFHPNDNRETIVLSGADFFKIFLPGAGFVPQAVDIRDIL